MNTRYLLEPCCIEKQAPYALSEAKGRAMMWTNGDVTVSHWFKALSYMAGPTHRLTLVVKEPDVQLMRWIRTWMQRGWTTEVRLTTATDASELVAAELEGLTDKVTIARDDTIQSELMAMEGSEATIIIAGPMLTATRPGIIIYAVRRLKEGSCDLLQAVAARHKRHQVKATTDGTDNTEQPKVASLEISKKTVKKSKAKKV